MDLKWAFDGIGTALFTLLITSATAGVVYRKIAHNKQVQKQKGGKNSTLYQAGKNITNGKKNRK